MKGRRRRCIFYIGYKQEGVIESTGRTDIARAYIEAGYANNVSTRSERLMVGIYLHATDCGREIADA
jgi:hypothetical protein